MRTVSFVAMILEREEPGYWRDRTRVPLSELTFELA
jgi:hypothetical protein